MKRVPSSPAEFGVRSYSTVDDELLSRTFSVAARYHPTEVILRIVEQRRVPRNPTTRGLSYPVTSRADHEEKN